MSVGVSHPCCLILVPLQSSDGVNAPQTRIRVVIDVAENFIGHRLGLWCKL